jgi:hypothetical protein
MLNEQIARQVFETLPEGGPLMMIMDRHDGAEPVMTQFDECSIVAAQLATDNSNCGYVIIALPKYAPESTLANIDLIEILLYQLSLIARLIEKHNRLCEVQMKHYRMPAESEAALN